MADDDVLASLAAHHRPPGQPGPCPEANLLAAYGVGRLPEADRAAVEAHAARCEDCSTALAALAGEALAAPASLDVARGRPRLRWALAAAAVVVAAIGGALWASARRTPSEPDSRAALRLAFARLETVDPAWRGVGPLDDGELARAESPLRGGLDLQSPAGTVLDVRPRFEWTAVPGAESYDLRVIGSDGRTAARATSRAATWEMGEGDLALDRGLAYVWKVVAHEAPGAAEGTRAFRVASESEARAWERTRGEVEALGPDAPRELALAHAALRRGLLLEAERSAEEHVRRHPDDDLGRRTLAHVRAALGRPDAPRGPVPK